MVLVVLACPTEETVTEAAGPPLGGSGSEAPDVTLLLSEVTDVIGAEVDFMITVLVGAVTATLLFTPVTLVTLTAGGVGSAVAGGGGVLAFMSAVCLLLFSCCC